MLKQLLAGLKAFGIYFLFVLVGILMAGSLFNLLFSSPVWFTLYCSVFLLMYTVFAYTDMYSLAQKDQRNRSNGAVSYPLKGLFIGIVAGIPIVVAMILYLVNGWESAPIPRLIYYIVIGLFAPYHMYLAKNFMPIYLIIGVYIPVLCTLGYMAGFYKIDTGKYFRKIFPYKPPKPSPKKRNRP